MMTKVHIIIIIIIILKRDAKSVNMNCYFYRSNIYCSHNNTVIIIESTELVVQMLLNVHTTTLFCMHALQSCRGQHKHLFL